METWEYKVLGFVPDGLAKSNQLKISDTENILNELGAAGWELTGTVSSGGDGPWYYKVFLKRRK